MLVTGRKQNNSSAPRKMILLDLVRFEDIRLLSLHAAQFMWYSSAEGIQVSCAKMPFCSQLQATAKSFSFPGCFCVLRCKNMSVRTARASSQGNSSPGQGVCACPLRIRSFIRVIGIWTQFWILNVEVADGVTNAVESEPETT